MTLTERYAVKYGKNKKDAAVEVAMMIGVLQDALMEDGEAKLSNLGTLKVVERAARTQRNPQNGELINCPAYKTVRFSAYKGFKNALK
jgi:DNA-binding protein HU-beta